MASKKMVSLLMGYGRVCYRNRAFFYHFIISNARIQILKIHPLANSGNKQKNSTIKHVCATVRLCWGLFCAWAPGKIVTRERKRMIRFIRCVVRVYNYSIVELERASRLRSRTCKAEKISMKKV